MIVGIGTDLVRIERLGDSLTRFGARFRARVFTQAELQLCAGRQDEVSCLAKRFAAKEAIAKALGKGVAGGITWQDMEVVTDASGRPVARLIGGAARILHEQGGNTIHVTLSDEGGFALAFVVLERCEA